MGARATYRAIGTGPMLVRTTAVPLAVLAGIRLWTVDLPALGVGVAVLVVLVAWALSLVPRVVVADGEVVVWHLLSVERFDAAAVTVDQVASTVWWYRTWNLVIVADGVAHPFPWISWQRHELSRPWAEPTPPPRALRYADRLRRSIQAAA